VIAAAVVLGGALAAAEPAAASSYEELARDATPVDDVGMLVSAFVDECRGSKRDIDRARCQGVHGFLKGALPGRKFAAAVDGAQTVQVSEYDARLKGIKLSVAGCVACQSPVEVGAGRERRFVTLKAPARGGGSLAGNVEVAHTTLTFATPAESNDWSSSVRPRLRTDFVFRPADAPWTTGSSRGYAFTLLGLRVVNRCTGEVVLSQPPSKGAAEIEKDESCEARVAKKAARDSDATPAGGEDLDAGQINRAMAAVRADMDACLARSPMRGTNQLAFEVAPSGIPQKVTLEGPAAGTPLAQCLGDAGSRAKFPPIVGEVQRFKYPVIRRK
jgi:hypothetical protein